VLDKVHEEPETNHKGKYKNNAMKTQRYEKPGMRAGIADITDTVMADMVHEASIEDYQDRRLIMYEKPEQKDGMLKINHKESKMFEEPELRMLKTIDIIDAIMDEKPGSRDGMLKIKHKNVNVNSINAVLLDMEYKAGINMFKEAKTRMLKTNPKGKNNTANPIEDPRTVRW
jgi:hypothetical protein